VLDGTNSGPDDTADTLGLPDIAKSYTAAPDCIASNVEDAQARLKRKVAALSFARTYLSTLGPAYREPLVANCPVKDWTHQEILHLALEEADVLRTVHPDDNNTVDPASVLVSACPATDWTTQVLDFALDEAEALRANAADRSVESADPNSCTCASTTANSFKGSTPNEASTLATSGKDMRTREKPRSTPNTETLSNLESHCAVRWSTSVPAC
jgi:citrate lyase beta subunit